MDYDGFMATPESLGTRGGVVTPDNDTDLDPPAKGVQVVSVAGGDALAVLPVGNADGDWITYDGVAVGFMPAFRVRRVRETTSCTVVWVGD